MPPSPFARVQALVKRIPPGRVATYGQLSKLIEGRLTPVGVGWAVPVFAYWLRFRKSEIQLPREQAVEVNYLALATLYSFCIPIKGTLALYDTVILLAIFLLYARAAARTR